ncbi:MAG: hypothetical protein ACI8ZM_002470 [Crocinitomix sp.]|jgi:hypothetical protein
MDGTENVESLEGVDIVSNIGGKVAVAAVVVGGAIFGVSYLLNGDARAQRQLQKQKVKFDKNKIPHYTLAKVKEYAGKSQRGELYRWGGSQHLPIEVYNHMVENRMKAIYWHPARLVEDLYRTMKGANFTTAITDIALAPVAAIFSMVATGGETDPRVRVWKELLKLNQDQLRFLHNYWIENSAEGDSFYDWVDGEWSSSETKAELLAKLSSSGVGRFVNKNK